LKFTHTHIILMSVFMPFWHLNYKTTCLEWNMLAIKVNIQDPPPKKKYTVYWVDNVSMGVGSIVIGHLITPNTRWLDNEPRHWLRQIPLENYILTFNRHRLKKEHTRKLFYFQHQLNIITKLIFDHMTTKHISNFTIIFGSLPKHRLRSFWSFSVDIYEV